MGHQDIPNRINVKSMYLNEGNISTAEVAQLIINSSAEATRFSRVSAEDPTEKLGSYRETKMQPHTD